MDSKKAQRVDMDGLKLSESPIHSKIVLEAQELEIGVCGEALSACCQAMTDALQEAHEGNYALQGNVFFVPTRWEPPYKLIRSLSAKFPDVRITLVADAFKYEYWIAKAVYERGRAVMDEVLTMNDGEKFEELFREIHNETHAEWKQKNELQKVRGGFAWGTSPDYVSGGSELEKAEGQE